MRMLNDANKVYEVEEVESIDATYGWNEKDGSTQDNPGLFVVERFMATANGFEMVDLGEYVLDGTPETFQKAAENFNNICLQAAEKGFFRLSDFENFELY